MAKELEFDSKGRKVRCKICEKFFHRLEVHIKKEHGISKSEYLKKFPGSPTISEAARKNASRAKRNQPFVKVDSENTSDTKDKALDVGFAKLYITDDSQLTDLQKSQVPKNDEDWELGRQERESLEIIAAGIEDGDNIFVFGPPGSGKTSLIKQLGAITNTPVFIFHFSDGICVEDFIGEKELKNIGSGVVTAWRDGAFTRCWKEGYFIVFDEISAINANIMLRLHGPLDGDDLVIMENGGEIVAKHKRTVIFATDNTNGRGDDTGMFSGTHILNEATLDRFGTCLKYGYPDKASERKILVSKTKISAEIANSMVEVANVIRESFANEQCYCTLSTRRLIAWAKKTLRFDDVRKAAEIAVIDRLSRDDGMFVESIIQRYFGGSV